MCSGAPTATLLSSTFSSFFFFNDTATTEIYTLSLHDALPISTRFVHALAPIAFGYLLAHYFSLLDRKSTRLNSSHPSISYAVFCLKKKTNPIHHCDTAATPRARPVRCADDWRSWPRAAHRSHPRSSSSLFFFNETGTPEISPLSLRDSLPI